MRSGRHKLNLFRSAAVAVGRSGLANRHKSQTITIDNNLNSNSNKSFRSVVTAIESNLNVVIDSSWRNRMDIAETNVTAKAWEICREYLNGAWKHLESKDLILTRVTGGLSNWLYFCSLPRGVTPMGEEPTQVLLRFYGQGHGENVLESLITELVICTLLSERKLGPKLHGVFPGGRIEQFIPSRPLQTHELRDPELSRLITQKMAQIHALNLPISKEPTWLWDTMGRWMTTVGESLTMTNISKMSAHEKEIAMTLVSYGLEGELEWLRAYLPTLQSPIVFSHNDLQEGNILIRQDANSVPASERLVVIDFEYCAYNYRGFDLANHFSEWMFNYNAGKAPGFTYEPTDAPSAEEQLRFVRQYLAVLRSEYAANHREMDQEFLHQPELFSEAHVLKEIQGFRLASHFFWTLWSIVNAQVSKISFGYWEYALTRVEVYRQLKMERFNNGNDNKASPSSQFQE